LKHHTYNMLPDSNTSEKYFLQRYGENKVAGSP
jgi:hypothetical protein